MESLSWNPIVRVWEQYFRKDDQLRRARDRFELVSIMYVGIHYQPAVYYDKPKSLAQKACCRRSLAITRP